MADMGVLYEYLSSRLTEFTFYSPVPQQTDTSRVKGMAGVVTALSQRTLNLLYKRLPP